jgi:hypothetical protein
MRGLAIGGAYIADAIERKKMTIPIISAAVDQFREELAAAWAP